MRKTITVLTFVLTVGLLAYSQSSAQAAPAAKPAAPAQGTAPAAATKPMAIINTTAGKLTCTLFPDKAPIGVANFIGLASGTKDWKTPSGAAKHGVPLYDGTIFHRVIPDFMIQGGDPAGTGSGPDPVKPFKNEVSANLLFDKAGRLAYANAGPDTNSSQFFITQVAFTGSQAQILNGHYTIFGQCDEDAVKLVTEIAGMSRDQRNDRPYRPVKIVHISIIRGTGGAAAAKPGAGTAAKKPAAAAPKASANSN